MPNRAVTMAVNTKRCLRLTYGGFIRVVEVHAYGQTRMGHDIMRVWQVAGGSRSGQPVGWKLMRLDETSSEQLVLEISQAPRPGYRAGDSAMRQIYCQV